MRVKRMKARCDHCGKWAGDCELCTFAEEYFPLLTCDNEFSFCADCAIDEKYDKEYWLKWIDKKRKLIEKRGKRFV